MYLHEYQSKQYFARFGIPTLQGRIASTPQDAAAIAAEFGSPVVVNAQALDSQRIFRVARTPEDAAHTARDILAMTVSGIRVRTLLIEPVADISAQFILGIYGDRDNSLVMLASAEGGSEISQIEQEHPNTLYRETINPFLGILEFQVRNLANGINLPREQWNAFTQIARGLYNCCVACDAMRAEINPLALTRNGDLVALGGKLVIDDNALFRQAELAAIRDVKAEHEGALEAHAAGISYVYLPGTIGCIVSGAGLGMATLDMLARHRATASGLLDLGGSIERDKLTTALRLILPNAQALLVNLFADKARCDEIARELLDALDAAQPVVPVVIRLAGRDADQGYALLASSALISTAVTTTEAVERVTAALKAKGSSDVYTGG